MLPDKKLTEEGKEKWNYLTELERISLVIKRLVSLLSRDSINNCVVIQSFEDKSLLSDKKLTEEEKE